MAADGQAASDLGYRCQIADGTPHDRWAGDPDGLIGRRGTPSILSILSAFLPAPLKEGPDSQNTQVILGKPDRGKGRMQVGGDDLLVIEADHRQILGHMKPALTQGVKKPHGGAVIVAENGRGPGGQNLLDDSVPTLLIGGTTNHKIGVISNTGSGQGIAIPL